MFERQRGRNQMALIDDPLTRRGCEMWLERVLGFYGEAGGVDVEVIDDQIALNERTAEYLYSEHTRTVLQYARGSRPKLEGHVREAAHECASDGDPVAAIARFCSALGQRAPRELDATKARKLRDWLDGAIGWLEG